MEGSTPVWTGQQFRHRLTVLSHAAVIMTLVTVWLIQLIDVLQPLFIALGIYFVLKPGADYLSKKGFPIMLSYITMLMLAILIVLVRVILPTSKRTIFSMMKTEWPIHETSRRAQIDLKSAVDWKSILDAGAQRMERWMRIWRAWVCSRRFRPSAAINGVLSNVGMFFIKGITVLFFLLFIIFEASCSRSY